MRIVIAPDSFKGSLSALQVANAIETGLLKVFQSASIVKIPIADGGEGTVDAMVAATNGIVRQCYVQGPLGDKIKSFWGILGDGQTAIIEMAAASGLTLLPDDKRNPRISSSYGTGQLIIKAMDYGCRKIIVGLGGSATNDGGSGMATALGVRFLDSSGNELASGGAALSDLKHIDLSGIDNRIKDTSILVACDVDNPLFGPNGASEVYGPQKGASPEDVIELDNALRVFAEVARTFTGKDVAEKPGAGAAGGMAAGLMYFTNAVLRPGIEIVIEATGMEESVKNAELVITGEGKTDAQTSFGKAPIGVGELAQKYNKVAVCLSGSLGDGAEAILEHGIHALLSITQGPISLTECMLQAESLAEKAAFRLALALKAGMELSNGRATEEARGRL
ncbi:MAG: glycerate kinase [Desulfomonilaceae bacterium]